MPVKKKPFTYYAVLSLFVITVVLLILGKTLADDSKERLTRTHLRSLPETVRTIFNQHQDVTQWFSQPPGTTLPKPVARLSEGLLKIPGVFRLKMWDKEGTVLWSDHAELIGQNFSQNHHFQVASSGKTAYNNEGFRKAENKTEQGKRVVVEVYLPVYDGNQVIGVIELYESDKELSSQMVSSQETLWTSLTIAGIGLYLLILAAYLLSHDIVTELSQKRKKD